jgi:putative membrane protein
MPLPAPWQITPLAVVAVALCVTYEFGLRSLALRQTFDHRRRTRRRSIVFYAGMLGAALVASSPLERWAMPWLSVHMILHVVEMFYLPPLLIVGAAWVPLLFAFPVEQRRRILSDYYRAPSLRWLRSATSIFTNPIFAIVAFNGVMLFWHLPAVYDWAAWHDWSMGWLMTPSFLIVGYLFWRVFLGSHPAPPRGSTRLQLIAIVTTAFVMLVLAMAMAIFTKDPWYSMNVIMDGSTAALRDQRFAAGILWVCGDFWVVPALVLVLYRLSNREGGVLGSLERALGRGEDQLPSSGVSSSASPASSVRKY